jgi:hypothetical protein
LASHSYLRLLPPAVAEAIQKSTARQRHAFASACAKLSVEHCADAILALDDGAKTTLARLRDHALTAIDTADARSIDQMLARREDQLYDEICALRRGDAVADYAAFIKLATQRHTIRALRATLLPDGLTAAARAAFETLSATRNEDSILCLARNTMALEP